MMFLQTTLALRVSVESVKVGLHAGECPQKDGCVPRRGPRWKVGLHLGECLPKVLFRACHMLGSTFSLQRLFLSPCLGNQ